MPLFERARVEVYLPDAAHPAYSQYLAILQREFTFAFGGCSLVRGLEGSYLSRLGDEMHDASIYCTRTRLSILSIILKSSPIMRTNFATPLCRPLRKKRSLLQFIRFIMPNRLQPFTARPRFVLSLRNTALPVR